jgi:hypothetical protein
MRRRRARTVTSHDAEDRAMAHRGYAPCRSERPRARNRRHSGGNRSGRAAAGVERHRATAPSAWWRSAARDRRWGSDLTPEGHAPRVNVDPHAASRRGRRAARRSRRVAGPRPRAQAEGAPIGGSRCDAPGGTRLGGVGGERLVGGEMPVVLDGEPQAAAHRRQLREARIAEFREPQAEVAQPENARSGSSGSSSVSSRVQPASGVNS